MHLLVLEHWLAKLENFTSIVAYNYVLGLVCCSHWTGSSVCMFLCYHCRAWLLALYSEFLCVKIIRGYWTLNSRKNQNTKFSFLSSNAYSFWVSSYVLCIPAHFSDEYVSFYVIDGHLTENTVHHLHIEWLKRMIRIWAYKATTCFSWHFVFLKGLSFAVL